MTKREPLFPKRYLMTHFFLFKTRERERERYEDMSPSLMVAAIFIAVVQKKRERDDKVRSDSISILAVVLCCPCGRGER